MFIASSNHGKEVVRSEISETALQQP